MENQNIVTPEIYDMHKYLFDEQGLKVGDTLPDGFKFPGQVELSGETVDFTITQEFLDANPGYVGEVGEVIQVPKEVVENPVYNNVLSHPEDSTSDVPSHPVNSGSEEVKKMMYEKKEVISDNIREVEGKNYHTIRLSDGSSYDLNEEKYQEYLNLNA